MFTAALIIIFITVTATTTIIAKKKKNSALGFFLFSYSSLTLLVMGVNSLLHDPTSPDAIILHTALLLVSAIIIYRHNKNINKAKLIAPIILICLLTPTIHIAKKFYTNSNKQIAQMSFEKGLKNFKNKNFYLASEDLILASKYGHAEAQCLLGALYENGYGVTQDYRKAIELYKKSASQNLAAAQNCLGLIYTHGYGIQQDLKKAMYWYKKAAAQGYLLSIHNMGVIYENGYGVEADNSKAYSWYTLAAQKGFKDSQKSIELLELLMSPEQIAQAKEESKKINLQAIND